MNEIRTDVLIVGGGLAGSYMAYLISQETKNKIVILENQGKIGGTLNLLELDLLKRNLILFRNPKNIDLVEHVLTSLNNLENIEIFTNTTGIRLTGNSIIALSKEYGLIKFRAKKYIFSTGARDATKWELGIVGKDAFGVFGAKTALKMFNEGYDLGKDYTIYGDTEIADYITCLLIERKKGTVKIKKVKENILDSCKCCNTLEKHRGKIIKTMGEKRISKIGIVNDNEVIELECDTLILAKKFIPRTVLLDMADVQYGETFKTNREDIFLCGEILKPYKLYDDMLQDCEKLLEELLDVM